MQGYRLFFMSDDGHVKGAAEMQCADDIEATLYAEDQRANQVIELWTGARLVAKFPKRQDA